MPVEFVRGDLFHAPGLDALAHGCNCVGSMDGGIAREFRKRWPEMYEEYRRRCQAGTFSLGSVFTWDAGDKTIFNLGTQHRPGADARLDAVEKALGRMVAVAEENRIMTVGLPRIGAGIGGLDWTDVRTVIERVGAGTSTRLVVFEEFEPAGHPSPSQS